MSDSQSDSVFKGAILTVAMRWADRSISFVSTLILARLLVPDDFGIIAMASVVVGLTDVLLDLGVNVALIRNREATADHYNTAWTLRLGQMCFSASLVFFCAGFAATYFKDGRIEAVLQVMSIGLILIGLENIGVINFQKEMRFHLDFRLAFTKRITGFIVTIITAWLTHSYWAMVIGTLASRSIGVILSYQMHPMRPRLSIAKIREIFSVSQWMLLNSVGNYLNHNLHNIMVGRRASATVMGGYSLACDISSMPTTEVLAPLNRVLFPALVRAKHDLVELKRVFLVAQSVQSLIGIPAGLGLALIAHEAVYILLGPKWAFVAPYIQILALANVVEAITTSSGYLMITLENIRNSVMVTWSKVIAFATIAAFFLPVTSAVYNLAWLRVAIMFGGLFLSFFMIARILKELSWLDISHSLFRPIVGTIVMSGLVLGIDTLIHLPLIPTLVIKITTGVVTYPLVVIGLWHLMGQPAGAESYLLTKIRSLKKNERH